MSKRYLTGLQPTSDQLHIGNYFGAVAPMVQFAKEASKNNDEVFIFVANMHALTGIHDPVVLRQNTINLVKIYIASWLDPKQVKIYTGAHIPAHAQLGRVFNCITHIGFMKRMHAFKSKVDLGLEDDVSVGTFTYPILMAADILLYDADFVPVGQDQKQHVEFARDIGQKFNHMFGDTFKLPEPYIKAEVAVVPGIDGRKMSKSYNNYIGMMDDAETIKKKVMQIPTDALPIEAAKDPDTCNVYKIYKLFLTADQDQTLRERYQAWGLSYKVVKTELADVVANFLLPFQERYHAVTDEQVAEILHTHSQEVAKIAAAKITDIYKKVGFSL